MGKLTNVRESGRAPLIISACLAPSEDGLGQEMNRWYNQEHAKQLEAEVPTWRRSTRYELVRQIERAGLSTAPRFLSIVEFEDGPLGEEAKFKGVLPQTEWTRQIMEKMDHIDAAKFRLVNGTGDVEANL